MVWYNFLRTTCIHVCAVTYEGIHVCVVITHSFRSLPQRMDTPVHTFPMCDWYVNIRVPKSKFNVHRIKCIHLTQVTFPVVDLLIITFNA